MVERLVQIEDLMEHSGVRFGTSGARGLVADMTDEVCYAYTLAFIQHLEQQGELLGSGPLAIGGDLRPSTERIMAAVAEAATAMNYEPLSCGRLPSPALACYGLLRQIPTAMVTGSHIPADRNGIKYTRASGEILKADEAAMRIQQVFIPPGMFDATGSFELTPQVGADHPAARKLYLDRYLDFFPPDCLAGLKLGVFQHSAVGRDLMVDLYTALGAEITPLGRSDTFVAVDTEAIRPEDVEDAQRWCNYYDFDALVSTDGDSDRPLIADEQGKWLRGDVAGIICASWLGADAVVTPVSCNTAVERCRRFDKVIRTRIGSPFVIEGMQWAEADGYKTVVGYEANGGFLLHSPIVRWERALSPLPTRDAILLHLAVLMAACESGQPLSKLSDGLPRRFTWSDRLKAFPLETSRAKMEALYQGDPERDCQAVADTFGDFFGPAEVVDGTDGVRITFLNGEIIHLRPSGNAPEFRCYTEATSEERARRINATCLAIMETWRTPG